MKITEQNAKALDSNFYDKQIINNNIVILNQQVDTLVLHLYPHQLFNEQQLNAYNTFVDDLNDLKKQAQAIQGEQVKRFTRKTVKGVDFKVMATCPGRFGVNLMCGNFQMMFNKITNKTNAPIVKIEFRSEFLTRFGYVQCINDVFNVVKSFLPTFKIKVYELHLCTDFQGYDIQEADKDRMSFRNRGLQDFTEVDSTLFGSGRKKTGFSFGKDSFMMRMYDKTHQIQCKKTAGYVQALRWDVNEHFDPTAKVWRLEYQFRRDYLKTLVGKDGLVDGFEQVLNSIPDLWAHAMQRFVHYNLNKQQCTDMYHNDVTYETIKKRKQRAGLSNLWKTLSTFNNTESTHKIVKYKEVKRPESQYVINSFKGVVTTMVKYCHGDFDSNKLNEFILQANEDELNKSGFSILDNAKLKCLDYMNDNKTSFMQNGVMMDGFEEYNTNLKENLTKHWNSINDITKKNDFLTACIEKGTMLYSNVQDN